MTTSKVLKLLKSAPLRSLAQGSTLRLRSKLPNTDVRILPGWREDGHVELSIANDEKTAVGDDWFTFRVTEDDKEMTSLGRRESSIAMELELDPDATHDEGSPSLTITANVPEKLNLSCQLEGGGNIVIEKKLEGDIDIYSEDGNLSVDKLRGHNIRLSFPSSESVIHVRDIIEGETVDVQTQGRFRAKRVHGSRVEIVANHDEESAVSETVEPLEDDDEGATIDISSLYVSAPGVITTNSEATLIVDAGALDGSRAIRVKSHHGHLNAIVTPKPTDEGAAKSIDSSLPMVELGGVNGSCNILIDQLDDYQLSATTTSAKVHVDSFAPDSLSSIAASAGNVEVTLDRKLECDLRLLACPNADVFVDSLLDEEPAAIAQMLRQHDDSLDSSGSSSIDISTDSYSSRSPGEEDSYQRIHYRDGRVENKSQEPGSRFEVRMGAGKINHEGATQQALNSFSPKESDQPTQPLLVAATEGTISVESLSWLGAIARRYGLEEESGRENLGRQATRRGRPLVPNQ